jgi:hypothetical protein
MFFTSHTSSKRIMRAGGKKDALHVTRHTSHITHHTSHVTRHMSSWQGDGPVKAEHIA